MFHEFLVYLWRNLCSSPLPVFNLDLLLLLHCSCSLYGTVAQSLSHTQLFVIHGLQHTRPPCLPPSLKFMSIEAVMPSSRLILCHPPLLLPSLVPSIRVFSNELTLHIRWPRYWSFDFSISSSNEYLGLISIRIDYS